MYVQSKAWVDVFQPSNLSDCFLPEATKNYIQSQIDKDDLPSMFFCGPPGIGKTSTAIAIAKQLDLEFLKINASLYGNIDTIRTDIQQFASSIAFNGKKKMIILDEADHLTAAAQASLRGVIDDFTNNVCFVLTANFRNKIIEPVISRLTEVDFLFPRAELGSLAKNLYSFIISRLEEEQVKYDAKAVQTFLRDRLSKSTDIRKILILAQRIANTKVFNGDSLMITDDSRLSELIGLIKSKNFNNIRTWVGENPDIDPSEIFRYVYDNSKQFCQPAQIPMLVSIINEHQYKHAFVIDKEINMVTMLATISASL